MALLKKHSFLLVCIALLLGARLSDQFLLFSNYKAIDSQHFESQLGFKEQLADRYIDTLISNAYGRQFAKYVNDNSKQLDWLYNEHGIVFYLWDKETLVYWTNNELAISANRNDFKNGFLPVGNAQVEVRLKDKNSIRVAAFIILRTQYPYENEYLINAFHPTFNLDTNIELVHGSEQDKYAIRSYQGKYLFSLVDSAIPGNELSRLLAILLFIGALVCAVLYIRQLFRSIRFNHKKYLLFVAVVVAIRVLMQVLQVPNVLYGFDLFQTTKLESSLFFSSLGDLLLSVIFGAYLIFIYYTKTDGLGKISDSKYWKWVFLFMRLLFLVMYAGVSIYIFNRLINSSNIQFEAYDILNLSIYSFVGYVIVLLLFVGLIMLMDKFILQCKQLFVFKQFALVSIPLLALMLWVMAILFNSPDYFAIFFMLFLLGFWSYIRFNKKPRFGSLVILVVLFSLFSTWLIRNRNYHNRIENSKQIAINLAREQDPVVEQILAEHIPEMKVDSVVEDILASNWFDYEKLVKHIQGQYFSGYLKGYDFQLTVCNPYDSVLIDEQNDYWFHCFSFFNDLLLHNGEPTSVEGLFYLKDAVGNINYFLQVPIHLKATESEVLLFFELILKPNFEVLGYPKLLLQKNANNKNSQAITYAKYVGNQLVSKSGKFPYAFDPRVYGSVDNQFSFFQSEGYDHLMYKDKNNLTVLVSNPSVDFYNVLVSFTYIFIFYLIQILIVLSFVNRYVHLFDIQLSIKNRIVFAMVLILFFSLVLVGTGTVYYTVNQFDNQQISLMSEKSQSVLVELEHKLADVTNLKDVEPEYLSNLLIKFSNVFYSDINLYDLQGNLVASSRNQIFDKALLSKKMNAVAFRELVLNKKARIVQKEHIGNLNYYSSYVPFMGGNGQLLAYLNLPYFSKEVLLKQELMMVVVAVINVYAFLIILSVIIAIYVSNRFTAPLRMVQQRFRDIDIGKQNERIEYHGKDEIGDLVNEYNRMLSELSESAQLLAKSEREMAWREMAKQIAHEIKNPLTPMKLSVQLLERSMNNNDPDFNERFFKVSRTLIEQIDSLSSIATAFSQFAQMPILRSEKVNVVERLKQSAELFKDHSNIPIEVIYPDKEEIWVRADNERMLQIFNNLIKNARQAITSKGKGRIVIRFKESESQVIVEIEDDGIGVEKEKEDRLFQPNFTTKTSGTGLGLAIVKTIVEQFGGKIWFHSVPNVKTSFFILLPLYVD